MASRKTPAQNPLLPAPLPARSGLHLERCLERKSADRATSGRRQAVTECADTVRHAAADGLLCGWDGDVLGILAVSN